DIALFIYDSQGALVCSQTNAGPIAECNWLPEHDEEFSIVIENNSETIAKYALMTN
ncbi:MAG: hypothetical protein JKY99_05360, partial [Rhizobiales bacterium]|nr:hypothetical protein [Hyphomicrobiales bacterium]